MMDTILELENLGTIIVANSVSNDDLSDWFTTIYALSAGLQYRDQNAIPNAIENFEVVSASRFQELAAIGFLYAGNTKLQQAIDDRVVLGCRREGTSEVRFQSSQLGRESWRSD